MLASMLIDCAVEMVECMVWTGSVAKGDGMERVVNEMGEVLLSRYGAGTEAMVSSVRHRAHLETAVEFLDGFLRTGKSRELPYGGICL